MGKPIHPKLGRFKSARVVFQGKFPPGERERLAVITQAQGGVVANDLNAMTSHLVLSGATARKKAEALRKKGAAIEILDAASFRELVNPTHDELIALLKDGQRGAASLMSAAPPADDNRHGAAPGSPRLIGACLDRSNLSGLDLRGLAFEKCTFIGAKLDGTRIAEAIECDFSQARGDGPQIGKFNLSRFTNAQLTGAVFCSHLHGSDFTGARLDNSTFTDSFWASRVVKPPSKQGACFRRASLRGCVFDDVWNDGADFREAKLDGAAFKGCHLDGANFQGTQAHGALLVANYLRKSDFSKASLVGANLAEADLTNAVLDGADLTDVNLRGAKIKASALEGIKGVDSHSTAAGAVGPALAELDLLFQKCKEVDISFRVGKHPDGEVHQLQITAYPIFAYLDLPDLNDKVQPWPRGTVPFVKNNPTSRMRVRSSSGTLRDAQGQKS